MNKDEFLEEVKNAFIWEGSARVYQLSDGILQIEGTSVVEHSGDENGIHEQASELKELSFTDENDEKTYSVKKVECETKTEERISCDEYIVRVKGMVEYKEVVITEIQTK